MAAKEPAILLDHIRELAGAGPDRLPDRELLRRFACCGDQAAFEAVVRRHGPLVLGIGRRLLGNTHDAEDVFQAAFLVLARKAASLRWQESVASWLCEVARRLALEARARAARRREQEALAPRRSRADPLADISLREAQAVLEEELGRLPHRCQAPLLLCCLEGRSRDEAAQDLGLSLGTLKRRLEQGRELLRARLRRRGLELSGLLLPLELGRGSATGLPAALRTSTTQAAMAVMTGRTAAVSARVAALAAGAGSGTGVARVWVAGAVVLVVALLAGGAGLLARRGAEAPPAPGPEGNLAPAPAPQPADPPGGPRPPGAILRLGALGLRHGTGIRGSALSPDGRRLATASGQSVALWDLRAGKRLQLFPCDRWPRWSAPRLAFSPDGQRLGYVHGPSFACVWDLGTGKELSRYEGKTARYGPCQFTPDGKEFALAEEERIGFWDPGTGTLTRSVPVKDTRWLSPDAGTFVREENDRVVLGDTRTGQDTLRLAVTANDGIENGIAFSPDGKRIALVRRHDGVQVRDVAGGKLLASFPLPDSARYKNAGQDFWECQVGFSADGQTLLLGTRAGLVHRWDLSARQELPPLKKHSAAATGVYAPDGRAVISTGDDGLIRIWDAATGREAAEPEAYAGRTHAAYWAQGDLAAIADAQGRVDLWNATGGKRLRALCRRGPAVTKLAFAPDGKSLAAAGEDGKVRFWDVSSSTKDRQAGSTEGQQAGGREGEALVAKGQDLTYVRTMTFSPDGRSLCVIDGRYRMRLYQIATGEVRWRGESACARFSPNGVTLAASDGAFTVGGKEETDLTFLDAGTGRSRLKVPVQGDRSVGYHGVYEVCFAPDGRLLAVAPPGGTVCLCDPRTGEEVRRFQAVFPPRADDDNLLWRKLEVEAHASALAFSPDARLLASCGSDGAVRLWEVATGQKVLELKGHEGESSYAAFSSNGRSLLSAGEDGQVYLWGLRPPPSPGAKPTPEALWAGLGAAKAEDAYRAVWGMSDAAAATFLRKKIDPAERVGEERLARLITDLGSDQFPVREAATTQLEALGEQAAPALRRAMEAGPDPEVRRRLQRLLDTLKAGPSPTELRQSRAVQALELNATTEAREVLRVWAGGASEARLTKEAAAALQRLEGGPRPLP
jgi:RNA polymerase sigma factor (sigma-70 family)